MTAIYITLTLLFFGFWSLLFATFLLAMWPVTLSVLVVWLVYRAYNSACKQRHNVV